MLRNRLLRCKNVKRVKRALVAMMLNAVMIASMLPISAYARTEAEINNNAVIRVTGIKNAIDISSGVGDVKADGAVTGWTAITDTADIYVPWAKKYAQSQAEAAVSVVKVSLPAAAISKSDLKVSLYSPSVKSDSRYSVYRYKDGSWSPVTSTVRDEYIDVDMTGSAGDVLLITKCPSFRYEHNPADNPKVLNDAIVNPDAVYGFSPNPDSPRLREYVDALDWTDPVAVAKAKKEREEYHAKNAELYGMIETMLAQGKDIEAIARAVSRRRNELRLESYGKDPVGLAKVKKSNLDTYGNEEGPTIEFLYAKYGGSWQTILEKALSSNAGMDACLGLYDDMYYVQELNR